MSGKLYLRCLQETLTIAMVNCFGWTIPSSMVGVASVSSCIHFGLFDALDALIFQTPLNFEKLLRRGIISGVTSCADSSVPLWTLRAQEVAVDSVLDFADCGLGSLMSWVRVLVPSVEARLILSVVQLTVMNWAYLLLSLEIVLLWQGSCVQDWSSILRPGQVRLLQVCLLIL